MTPAPKNGHASQFFFTVLLENIAFLEKMVNYKIIYNLSRKRRLFIFSVRSSSPPEKGYSLKNFHSPFSQKMLLSFEKNSPVPENRFQFSYFNNKFGFRNSKFSKRNNNY